MDNELKSHKHKVRVVVHVPAPYFFSLVMWLIIEDERDEYIASSVKAYCPRTEKSLEVFKHELLGSITDLTTNVPAVVELLKKEGRLSDIKGKLGKFIGKLTGALLDATQLDSNAILLQKAAKCIEA